MTETRPKRPLLAQDDEENSDLIYDLADSIASVEQCLSTLATKTPAQIADSLEATDQAKLLTLMAYTLHSLYFGENPLEHPVKQELERVREYMNKIKSATDKPSMKLNVAAANRFINHALTDQDEEKGGEEKGEKTDEKEQGWEEPKKVATTNKQRENKKRKK
ncbi:C1D nuclear receptor corepressor [Planoprotostelium fungivorum]|uniref:Nuclear nucleic acid-binding protein C1D n=1 Tax=Planoprotostelium fungivorum TaxID=1890364 RepID=A0A2P6NNT4_9EUKA|nr:C1D nuclear receptor corepressor [Planoprotostelium fungivorum]